MARKRLLVLVLPPDRLALPQRSQADGEPGRASGGAGGPRCPAEGARRCGRKTAAAAPEEEKRTFFGRNVASAFLGRSPFTAFRNQVLIVLTALPLGRGLALMSIKGEPVGAFVGSVCGRLASSLPLTATPGRAWAQKGDPPSYGGGTRLAGAPVAEGPQEPGHGSRLIPQRGGAGRRQLMFLVVDVSLPFCL